MHFDECAAFMLIYSTVVSLEEQFFENPSSDDTIRQALSNLKAHYSNLEYEGYLFLMMVACGIQMIGKE